MSMRRFLILVLVLVLVVYAFAAFAATVVLEGNLHLNKRPVSHRDAVARYVSAAGGQLEESTVQAKDGAVLRGWLLTPREWNGRSVIVLHGLTDNREGGLGPASLYFEHGYSVLLPDSRAHGESGGEIATYGVLERDDIARWVALLEEKHPTCIYGQGASMGAALLLQSLDTAKFCAVIAESAFDSFKQAALFRIDAITGLRSPAWKLLSVPALDIALLYIRMRHGVDLPEAQPASAVQRTHVPVLLIAGSADRTIDPASSRRMHALGAELWEIPGADHLDVSRMAGPAYSKRCLSWFETHREYAK